MSKYDKLRAQIAQDTEPTKFDSIRNMIGQTEKSGNKYDNAFEALEDRQVWGGRKSGLLTPWDDPNADDTDKKLAQRQPWSHQVANGLGRTVAGIVTGTVGNIASAIDLEDYHNVNDEVGNWLSAAMKQANDKVKENAPIYRENPNKALDLGDSAWWFDNGFSLVESVSAFAASGGIIAKGLMALSRIKRASNFANAVLGSNRAKAASATFNTVTNAVMLNQAEAIMEASDVYQEIYDMQMKEHGDEVKARQKAADGASTTVSVNRLNIPLNLTSAGLFFRTPKATRRFLENPYTKANLGRGALEGAQESTEEIVNMIAGNKGRSVGMDTKYDRQDILMDILSPQGAEAALLGFVGGMGQTALTTELVNRLNKVVDPKTGKKISVRDYNIQEYEDFKAEIDKLDKIAESNDIGSFTSAFKSAADIQQITAAIQKADELGMKEKSADLRKLLLSNQAWTSFERGTTEHLIKLYQSLGDGEQKPGMEDNYKERSKEAVKYIKEMEKVYNRVQQYENPAQVYYNRAKSYTLNQEYVDYKKEAAAAYADLAPIIARMGDNEFFDPASVSPEFLSREKYDTDKEQKVADRIKNTPEYRDYVNAQLDAKEVAKELEDLDKEYEKITEGSYQEKAKRDKEKANKKFREFLAKISDEAEARVSREAEEAAVQERIDAQKREEEAAVEQEKIQKEKLKKEVKALENAAVGDIVNITSAMSKKFGGKEGEIIKREKGKITIKDLETGHTFEISEKLEKKPEPKPTETIEDYSTEGGDTPPITQEEVNANDPALNPELVQPENGGAKVVSTKDKGGEYFTWIEEQYPLLPQYERNPVSKKNKPVTFEINPNLDALPEGEHKERLKAAVAAYNEKAFDDPAKRQLMVDFLPLNVVFRQESENKPKIAGPLETLPYSNENGAQDNFNDYTLYLRAHIIEALSKGYTPDQVIGSVQDQYKGLLQIDSTPMGTPERENAVHDLHAFGGDMSKVQIFMVDRSRNLVDTSGKVVRHGIGAKGEIYTVIPQANGEPFYLKLNVKRMAQDEAEILYELYKQRMLDAETGINTTISDLPKDLQDKITKAFGPNKDNPYASPLELIGKKKDTTIKDLTDFLIYDNSTNSKSQVRLDGAVLRYGDKFTYKTYVELEQNKEAFIKFLTESKRHHIKYRLKRNDPATSKIHAANRKYVEYLLGSKILNTNAVVKEPTFQGRTSIYLNLDVKVDEKVIGTPHDPNKARPVKQRPIKGKPEDIDDAGTPATGTKIDNLEAKVRAEWAEAIKDMQDMIKSIKAKGKKATAKELDGVKNLEVAIANINQSYINRLKLAGFKNLEVPGEDAPTSTKSKVTVEGTSVLVKKDDKSNWSLRVAKDGTVYNENTGAKVDDDKLINKAHLKSGHVTWDKIEVEKGTYAVTSDGRIINITKGGKSNGNSISKKSSIAKKVLAKRDEMVKPAAKAQAPVEPKEKIDYRVKAGIDSIVQDLLTEEFEAKVESKTNPNQVTFLTDANMEALITKIYEHYDQNRSGKISESGKKVVPLHEVPGTPENFSKKTAPTKKPKGEQVTDIKQTQQEKEINKEPEKDCGPTSGTPVKKTRAEERKEMRDRKKRK